MHNVFHNNYAEGYALQCFHFIGKASPVIIKSGDYVQVQVELAEFEKMQAGHGGWAGQMSEVRDLVRYVAMPCEMYSGKFVRK